MINVVATKVQELIFRFAQQTRTWPVATTGKAGWSQAVPGYGSWAQRERECRRQGRHVVEEVVVTSRLDTAVGLVHG
jgi:hypothetical protein